MLKLEKRKIKGKDKENLSRAWTEWGKEIASK